jgi:hypothetical protein
MFVFVVKRHQLAGMGQKQAAAREACGGMVGITACRVHLLYAGVGFTRLWLLERSSEVALPGSGGTRGSCNAAVPCSQQ